MANRFSYPINYEKALAADQRDIASHTLHLEQGWVCTPEQAANAIRVDLGDLVVLNESIATALGLTFADRCDIAEARGYESGIPADMAEQSTSPTWGRILALGLVAMYGGGGLTSAEATKKDLRRAKASLAAHLRNRKLARLRGR